MSERNDSDTKAEEGSSSPDGYEDTVVEILSLGDDDDADAATAPDRAHDPGTASDSVAVRRLDSQLAAERERALRLRADFDNFRKRTERDRAEIERYALTDVLRELLPVVDNLERALSVQSGQSEVGDLRKGVEMIARQFQEVLKRYGLTPIPALGERFDPSVHEAVIQEESDSVAAPTVALELQRGYRLNDRLLRPSMVKVAVPRETTDDGSTTDSSQ
ncbi:MAG: nucleotide exchange factor GrpE [Thermoanaerobaculia bacterium]|jgi:molecular chaperone GrpE|nr:nucleotide exchange factor GrpE [Thermoanaerobaculia bacterium]MBP9824217.1 nucleotide exchange factor GrpE [Thermoanaerobaculia bacterium]